MVFNLYAWNYLYAAAQIRTNNSMRFHFPQFIVYFKFDSMSRAIPSMKFPLFNLIAFFRFLIKIIVVNRKKTEWNMCFMGCLFRIQSNILGRGIFVLFEKEMKLKPYQPKTLNFFISCNNIRRKLLVDFPCIKSSSFHRKIERFFFYPKRELENTDS